MSVPGLRGKGWLIAFLVTRVLVSAYNYVPQLMLRNGTLAPEEYRAVLVFGGQTILNAISFALLVAFILAMTPLVHGGAGVRNLLWSFRGRITRQLFWIVSIALATLNTVVGVSLAGPGDDFTAPRVITSLLWLAVGTYIALAAQVKRWHDRGKSGWWVLINLVPFIGGIWALVELGFLKGTEGPNRFGPQASSTEGTVMQVPQHAAVI
jgi:uncharacterized membrane protein YhaH (DUF805 family)